MAPLVNKVNLVNRVSEDPLVLRAVMVRPVPMEMVFQVRRVNVVPMVVLARKEHKEKKGHLVHLVEKVQKVMLAHFLAPLENQV